jgi:type IV pilus assembly protein PilB
MKEHHISSQHMNFAHHLLQNGDLDQQSCESIRLRAQQNQQTFITELIHADLIPDDRLAKTMADCFNLPFFDLSQFENNISSDNNLHLSIVKKYLALPLFENEQELNIAISDPTSPELNEISFLTGKKCQWNIVEAQKLHDLINKITHRDFSRVLQNINHSIDNSFDSLTDDNDHSSNANAPIVRFIHQILCDAVSQNASDIHFEPFENQYRIRFRRDGILSTVSQAPIKLASTLTTRLKILSNLDIAERRIPQDGRFQLKFSAQRNIDIRVNTCPTLQGEKVVLRLLESKIDNLCIDSLGMTQSQKTLFLKALQRTQGLILVTGPTGSGKTTTLYSGLQRLNTLEKNISTVEDPVEMQIDGINQVHINLKTGLTFAVALRAFLRQDPDIMMVGEIRDLETAEIAVKASQTGHLVLSTVHTNNAPETLTRLVNMGIPAYNIASSVSLIVAQRLVRRLCRYCKKALSIPKKALLQAGFFETEWDQLQLYGPSNRQCEHCENGYQGRLALFEVMPISETMARIMMEGLGTRDLANQAQLENIANLRQSGLEKVRLGLTSLSEIDRITGAPI